MGLLQLFRVAVCNGRNWNPKKVGEYMFAGFNSVLDETEQVPFERLLDQLEVSKGNPEFEVGMHHAELVFSATYGMTAQLEMAPIVVEARKMAAGLQEVSNSLQGLMDIPTDPDTGFRMAVMQLTVQKELESRFPE